MNTGNITVDLFEESVKSRVELAKANLKAQELRHQQHLDFLKEHADKIMSEWDGDNAGIAEDRAMIAKEIKDKVAEIEELLKQL